MKNYCNKCKVELEQSVSHCPLCGKCINEKLVDKEVLHENFPTDHKFQKDKKEALRATASLLILANFLIVFSELLLEGDINFSIYVAVSTLFVFFGIIIPIKNNWALVNYHSIFYVAFTLYIVFLENYTNSFGWGITYVIPLFATAFSVYNFAMVLSNIKNRIEYILPIIILTVIAIICFALNYFGDLMLWPSLVAFLTTISVISVSFIFRSSKILKALAKKLHF
jgi:hypothetical protein